MVVQAIEVLYLNLATELNHPAELVCTYKTPKPTAVEGTRVIRARAGFLETPEAYTMSGTAIPRRRSYKAMPSLERSTARAGATHSTTDIEASRSTSRDLSMRRSLLPRPPAPVSPASATRKPATRAQARKSEETIMWELVRRVGPGRG